MNHKSGRPQSIIGTITSIKTRPLEKEIADLRQQLDEASKRNSKLSLQIEFDAEESQKVEDSMQCVINAKTANLTAYHEQITAKDATIEGLKVALEKIKQQIDLGCGQTAYSIATKALSDTPAIPEKGKQA